MRDPEIPIVPEGGHNIDELPKEVSAAGVSVHPTSIPISQPVKNMGVQPAGLNVIPPAPSASIPISDDQIAEGLKKSISDSFLWLAQWCVRKLKQVHIGLKSIHGKLMRVQT